MTNREIEKLKKIAIDVAEVHNNIAGVISVRPDYNCMTNKQMPAVHMDSDTFQKSFDTYEYEEGCNGYGYIFVNVDGVRFFAMVEKSELENGANHD